MGVKLSIDDFGTGYSSMAYLKSLPVHELKVDRSFVSQMLGNSSDAVIVHSTVDLGRNLGLRVVAEGVENALTLQHLDLLGCHAVQGYHISRPVAPTDLMTWLEQQTASATPQLATDQRPPPLIPPLSIPMARAHKLDRRDRVGVSQLLVTPTTHTRIVQQDLAMTKVSRAIHCWVNTPRRYGLPRQGGGGRCWLSARYIAAQDVNKVWRQTLKGGRGTLAMSRPTAKRRRGVGRRIGVQMIGTVDPRHHRTPVKLVSRSRSGTNTAPR